MSVPNFDPWSDAKRPPTRAYRAYCAYLDPNLGTSGTIGTGAESISCAPQPDRVRTWERQLCAAMLALGVADCHASPAGKLVTSAIEFCRGPWPARLVSLGWGECDLFAVADGSGGSRGLIEFLDGRQIRLATSDAVYVTGCPLSVFVRACSVMVEPSRVWDLPFRR